jgi:NitT/TauT family transport system permease protein
VVAIIILLGLGARQMAVPFVLMQQPSISLSPSVLPGYALRTTMRMLAALIASLISTLTYATAAAKSRRDAGAIWCALPPGISAEPGSC